MRTSRRDAGLVVLALGVLLSQGCKKQAAPVQPVVRSVPRVAEPVQPQFPADPAPVNTVDAGKALPRQSRRRPAQVEQMPRPPVDAQALAEMQRQRDAKLLQQQQAASQRQQLELNGVVQQSIKIQQEQQAEPRIQEAPEVPITQPTVPGQEGQRIQDNPVPPPPQTNPAPAPGQPEAPEL